MAHDFLFELGCEELPSGSVRFLAEELSKSVLASLDKEELNYAAFRTFATPRRIALLIEALEDCQKSQTTTRRGPAAVAAYDKEGKPTQALLGFAKSCAVDPSQLQTIHTEKGDWIVYESTSPGKKTKELMPKLIKEALSSLPIAKPMRWGSGDTEFARPVHWALMIYGNEPIHTELLGVETGNSTMGHRFHHPAPIQISCADTYEEQLKEAYVIANFGTRRKLIMNQVAKICDKVQAIAVMPEELLDEVCSIVEWPVALLAHYDKEFLQVPAEALIAAMQGHQKCFALKDKDGTLLPYFITIANIASINSKEVIHGNEKVMRARLSDAAFFYHQDKKRTLSSHIPETEQVIFQTKLGSLYDKSMRIRALMEHLAHALKLDTVKAQRAADLSKCDLMTGMVGEFPELQGLMGYYYALNDREPKEVAQALNEQYMPRFAQDDLPESELGMGLSLADRIDTLVGIFGIGQKPTGVKDPFKLRRHALAVVRLGLSIATPLNISTLIKEAVENYNGLFSHDHEGVKELHNFILERLPAYYQNKGISSDMIGAVLARQNDWLYDLDKRLHALKEFAAMPEAVSLSAACKRVNNILSQAGGSDNFGDIKPASLTEKAEKNLYDKLLSVEQTIDPLYSAADYTTLLSQLASLKEPVDVFFEEVMVMVEDKEIRRNRLALLVHLQDLLQGVADISQLQWV